MHSKLETCFIHRITTGSQYREIPGATSPSCPIWRKPRVQWDESPHGGGCIFRSSNVSVLMLRLTSSSEAKYNNNSRYLRVNKIHKYKLFHYNWGMSVFCRAARANVFFEGMPRVRHSALHSCLGLRNVLLHTPMVVWFRWMKEPSHCCSNILTRILLIINIDCN